MSDLVERLKQGSFGIDAKTDDECLHKMNDMATEAAARIEQLEAEVARLREAEAALAWFHVHATSLKCDVRSAHYNRGNGTTEWMREEDRDFRADLEKALERARAALAGKERGHG